MAQPQNLLSIGSDVSGGGVENQGRGEAEAEEGLGNQVGSDVSGGGEAGGVENQGRVEAEVLGNQG
ncbi:MAG: hypothetical protein Q8807_03800, partial ['Waltheria sp.' little leaf phytoplasma]|nr:hypothetical protein ['Waltheria sp.' little leaf phytoplasma]